MTQFNTAQSGSPLSQDPAISLMNMLGGSATSNPVGLWGGTGSSSSLPAASLVRVDTKWARMDKHNIIIIERMPFDLEEQTLGMQRFRVTENRRVQIWCDTLTARNNRWLVEQECFRIINGNPTYLQGNGIDYIKAYGLTPIHITSFSDQMRQVQEEQTLARSFFMIKMIYDLVKG